MKKVSLYKFTHILLLKNDGQLKQKNDKKKSPNLLKNKNHVPKKITSSLKTKKQNKTKQLLHPQPKKSKKEKKRKKKATSREREKKRIRKKEEATCPGKHKKEKEKKKQLSLHLEEKTFWWVRG